MSSETIAALAGGAVGAIVGSFGAYIVGLIVERRARKREDEKDEARKLREYSRNITNAEINCQHYLVVLFDAQRLLKQFADTEKSGWMITLPRIIEMREFSTLEFRNNELTNNWLTLMFRIEKYNHMIREFDEYYSSVAKMQEAAAFRGEVAVSKTVKAQIDTTLGLAGKLLEIVDGLLESVKDVYSYVLVHAEISLKEDEKISSVVQLNSYKVNMRHYKKVRKSLDKRFTQDELYGDS